MGIYGLGADEALKVVKDGEPAVVRCRLRGASITKTGYLLPVSLYI